MVPRESQGSPGVPGEHGKGNALSSEGHEGTPDGGARRTLGTLGTPGGPFSEARPFWMRDEGHAGNLHLDCVPLPSIVALASGAPTPSNPSDGERTMLGTLCCSLYYGPTVRGPFCPIVCHRLLFIINGSNSDGPPVRKQPYILVCRSSSHSSIRCTYIPLR